PPPPPPPPPAPPPPPPPPAGGREEGSLDAISLYAVNSVSGESTYGTCPAGTPGKYKKQTDGTFAPEDATSTIWLNHEQATIYSCYPAGTIAQGGSAEAPVPTLAVPTGTIVYAPTIPADATRTSLDFATSATDYMYGVAYDDTKTPETDKYTTNQPVASNGRGSTPYNPNASKVSIGMEHAFSQISLIITKKEDYKGEAHVTAVSYQRTIPVLGNASKMQLTNGDITGTSTTSTTYSYDLSGLTNPLKITTKETDNITITNYALPCSGNTNQSTITLTVDGKQMSLENKNEPAWERGKINTYTIAIGPTGLELSGFTVVNWGTGADIPDAKL
ncbi:MAG: fimbrillin family protein, partial [Parabacteroides sp.]|nr:fimbrillin family protein [Parabacteroides sp.]